MKPVFKFIASHYFKSLWGPLFRIIFPIILILVIGEISTIRLYNDAIENNNLQKMIPNILVSLRSITSGVIISSTFIVAFFNFPSSIVTFRDSVVLKRISAAKVSKKQFIFASLLFYGIIMLFTLFWSMLVMGLLVVTRLKAIDNPWQYLLPYPGAEWKAILLYLLCVVVFLLFGLTIASIFKKVRTVSRVSSFINFPTTLLVGGIVPANQLSNSIIVDILRYLFLHTQPAVALNGFWREGGYPTNDLIIAIVASFFLIALFSFIIYKKFKWAE